MAVSPVTDVTDVTGAAGGTLAREALSDAELRAVSEGCSRWVSGAGPVDPRTELLSLAEEAARGGGADRYGDGGVVEEVEEQVRDLLGAPAAVLFPSGTMAQQVALRHACRSSPRVGLHATAHPVLHEDDALPVVQGLVPVVVGDRPVLADVAAAHERAPLGALLVELPQRETGGELLALDDLAALSAWCREHDVRLHLDGARLWECGPAFAPHPLSEVVGLADSVYVSLYKGLAAPAGAVLLGTPELAEHARTWRHRLGGTLPALWPLALGARRGLRERLPQVPVWVARAAELARALEAVGLVVQVPPVTALLHVVLPLDADEAQARVVEVARRHDVWLGRAQPRGPGRSIVEVTAGPRTLEIDPDEVAALLLEVVAR